MDRENLVTVYTVNNPVEAELVRAALDSADIPCEISGESQAGLAGVLQIAILTHADDAERARKYLRELKHVAREERKKAHDEREARRHAIQEAKEHSAEPDLSQAIQEGEPRPDVPPAPPAP
jgi:hypothetical protein